jgi:hypothetical protein
MNQENARSEALRTNQAFLIDGMIKAKQTSCAVINKYTK